MKHRYFKGFFAIVMTWIVVFTTALPAFANSGISYWHGVDATGATVMDGTCPVEVERELLTFDLAELYTRSYETKEQFLAYTGKVSAEYTLYNPADYDVTARLFFPVGSGIFASFYDEEGVLQSNVDAEKYDITVGGAVTSKRVRYSMNINTALAAIEQLPRIRDAYITDDFYKPDTLVMKYTYVVRDLNATNHSGVTVEINFDGSGGKTKVGVTPSDAGHSKESGRVTFLTGATSFVVYMIGEPLATPLEMKCYTYEDGQRVELPATVMGVKFEYPTLEELLLEHWSEEIGVSKVDWYNAMLTLLLEDATGGEHHYFSKSGTKALSMVAEKQDHLSFTVEDFLKNLMQWYEYEITVPAASRIVNKVVAPIYPAIDNEYRPAVYEYTYLLSPAGTWKRFGELEIVINTPYYLINSTLDGFEKTSYGYVLRRTGLPEQELIFTLSTSQDPQKPKSSLLKRIKRFQQREPEWFYTFAVGSLLIVSGITIWIVRLVKKRKAAKKKE